MTRKEFGDDFVWGVSTAAYQTEGAHQADDKGVSIWDVFTNSKGRIWQNQNGNHACDFYSCYKEDILLLKKMNIPHFRFSISWSRIYPDGSGKINEKGIEFYNELINFCLAQNITPWITVYHWDLPHALELKGGWTNRDIVGWFSDYVHTCIQYFGDRVKNWMVLNEPMVFTGAGYFLGIHAPGKKGIHNFLKSAHHATLCQAEGGRIMKSMRSDLQVGTTFSTSLIHPYTNSVADKSAAVRVDALVNRMFIEPLLGLGYPYKDLKFLERMHAIMQPGDEKMQQFDMDFIGVQNYTREIVSASLLTPFVKAKIIKAHKRNVPVTVMNWEIYPECMYEILKKYNRYRNIKQLIVTENGAAFPDDIHEGIINDSNRIDYLRNHIWEVLRAKKEGVNVKGYFVWSLTDNFEWAEGYLPRFGLTHVDFKTQERTIKESGKFYGRFLEG